MSNLILRLADCRQALFDANRIGDANDLAAEVERAFILMGEAMDALKALAKARGETPNG